MFGGGKLWDGENVAPRFVRRAADEFAVVDCDVVGLGLGRKCVLQHGYVWPGDVVRRVQQIHGNRFAIVGDADTVLGVGGKRD